MSTESNLPDISGWMEKLEAIDTTATTRILIVQVGEEWMAPERDMQIRTLERRIAEITLTHQGDLRVFRILGVVEGSKRDEWSHMIGSWAHFQHDRLTIMPLYSPKSKEASTLRIYDEGELDAYEEAVSALRERIKMKPLDISEFASGLSYLDRYPITGSL